MGPETQWRRCSACKQPIAFATTHWVCGVTTCNRARTGLVFCCVRCWEEHLPSANHREAWAVEKTSPTASAAGQSVRSAPAPSGPAQSAASQSAPARKGAAAAPDEVLIVASRLKDYIRAKSGFSTSDRVLEPLSAIVRRLCDQAVQSAAREGRNTVLDRDIPRG